jgi:hypothetical protein
MVSVALALQLMTVAWYFNLHASGRPPVRFGPYLTEATCEAVRARVSTRLQIGAHADAPVALPCFKVSVQENESALIN